MSKDEIITAVAITTDKQTLAKLSDVLNHREGNGSRKADPDTRLITMKEAANRLGISYTTVWRLVKEGSLTVISVRGKNRVKLASLMTYAGV